MAMLGVVSAIGWRFTGIAEQADRLWPSFAASGQTSGATAAKGSDQPAGLVLAELNGLKSEIARLSAANQQMTATIAAMQAQQRELQQRLTAATAATNLFSNPKLLHFNIVPAGRPLTAGSTTGPIRAGGSRSAASPPPTLGETRRLPASRANNAPLALGPPN